jgi:copper(I)-binding protein
MRTHFRHFLGAAAILCAHVAHAHSFKLGDLDIGHPHARATAAGQTIGGGFLTLANHGADDRLLGGSSPIAAKVELHTMQMDGDVMRMRQVETIALPAGQTVELKPGSYHLMFVGLKAPLKAGDKFPLTLRFEKAGAVEVTVNVDAAGAGMPAH